MLSTHPTTMAKETHSPQFTSMINATQLALAEFLDKKQKIATPLFFENLSSIAAEKEISTIIQRANDTISSIIDQYYPFDSITFDIANKLSLLYTNLIFLQKENTLILTQPNLTRNASKLHHLIVGNSSEPNLTLKKIAVEKSIELSKILHLSYLMIDQTTKYTLETKDEPLHEYKRTKPNTSKLKPDTKKELSNQLKSTKKNIAQINQFLTLASSTFWKNIEKIDPNLKSKQFSETYKIYFKTLEELKVHRRTLLLSKKRIKKLTTINTVTIENLKNRMLAYKKKLPLHQGISDLSYIFYQDAQQKLNEENKANLPRTRFDEIKTTPTQPNIKFFEFFSVKEAINKLHKYLIEFFNPLQGNAKLTEHEAELFKQLQIQINSIANANEIHSIEEILINIDQQLQNYSKENMIEISKGQIAYTDINAFSNGLLALAHLKKLYLLSIIHKDSIDSLPHRYSIYNEGDSASRFKFISNWAEEECVALLERVRTHTGKPFHNEETLYQRHHTKMWRVVGFFIKIGISLVACFTGLLKGLKYVFSCCKTRPRLSIVQEQTITSLSSIGMTSTSRITGHPSLPPQTRRTAELNISEAPSPRRKHPVNTLPGTENQQSYSPSYRR